MLELALHQVHKHVLPGAQHPGLLGVRLHRAQHRVRARHDDLRGALVRLQRENMVAGGEQWSPLLTLARVLYSPDCVLDLEGQFSLATPADLVAAQ